MHVHATEKDPFPFHLHDAMPWEPDEEPDQAICLDRTPRTTDYGANSNEQKA